MDAVSRTDHLEVETIGDVKLKGFDKPTSLCRVHPKE